MKPSANPAKEVYKKLRTESWEALWTREVHPAEQKVKAQIARQEAPASLRLDAKIKETRKLRIHLRTRRGMEVFVRHEMGVHPKLRSRFKILRTSPGCVALSALRPFTLSDLYQLRTFGSVNFVLGVLAKDEAKHTEV